MHIDNSRVRNLERKVKLLENAIRWLVSEIVKDNTVYSGGNTDYVERIDELLRGNRKRKK